jgi:hypothetical protein
MAKKKIEQIETPEAFLKPEGKIEVSPLSIDLGREDLNTVVTKLNEVIDFLNHGKEKDNG